MSQGVRDPFASEDFGKATPNGGVYFLPGSYPELEMLGCKLWKSAQDGSICFIAEFKILKSNVAERPAGSTASWVCKDKHPSFHGNVRDFVARCTGQPFADITQDVCRGVVSEGQPLKGTKLALVATNITTRSNRPFTKHSWSLLEVSPALKSE